MIIPAAVQFFLVEDELVALAREQPTSTMCSEALPQSCHPRLIADALVVRGWRVRHLLSPKRIEDHQMTPFARASGTEVTYPSESLF